MLSRLTKAGRWRAATVLALFYALCSVAPAASFAFADGPRAAHCLTGDDDHRLHSMQPHQHVSVTPHAHADGTSHRGKADSSEPAGKGEPSEGKCCGLIFVNALPASLANGNLPDLTRLAAIAPVERHAAGQPPARLDRPPNTTLPL